ncbi:MAG: hypothetical protein ACOC5T_03520 [Elusimicrobiota bacterium]
MRFECKNAGFINGLVPVCEVSTYSIIKDYTGLDKINIKVKDGGAEVSAFNGRVSVSNDISEMTVDNFEYFLREEGETTVRTSSLTSILDSFEDDEILEIFVRDVDGGGEELVICKKSDTDEYQTLPCLDNSVNLPKKSSSYGQKLTIDRDIFVNAIKNIKFAVGFEDHNFRYKHYYLVINTGRMRYIAGTGGRFVVLDIDSDKLFSIDGKKKKIEFLFPKESLNVVSKILATMDDEKIIISQTKENDNNAQIMFSVGSVKIILIDLDQTVKYPDVSGIVDDDNMSNKMVTSLSDWELVGKGIVATYDENMKKANRIPRANIIIGDEDTMIIESKDVLKAHRKVPVIDKKVEKPIQYICPSAYLKEISENGKGNIQIETYGEPKKPIVVRYYASSKVQKREDIKEDNEALGLTRRFTFFFAPLNATNNE